MITFDDILLGSYLFHSSVLASSIKDLRLPMNDKNLYAGSSSKLFFSNYILFSNAFRYSYRSYT